MSTEASPVERGRVNGPGSEALDTLYRFVAAIELTPMVAVHAFDRDGIVRFWNNASAQLYGIGSAEAIGQPLSSLLGYQAPDAKLDEVIAAIWDSGQAAPSRDWQVHTRAGKQLWVCSAMFPVRRTGEVDQIFCTDIDISARKQEEAALAQVGSNFLTLFDKSADAIVLIKGELMVDANPAAVQMFDCGDKRELVGKRLLDFSPARQPSGESSLDGDSSEVREARQNGNRRYEWCFQSCKGTPFWAEVLLTSITLDHEFLFYAVIRDISARKTSERTLFMAAQVFENCRDAIIITDALHRVVAVNRAFTDITGYSSREIVGHTLNDYSAATRDPSVFQMMWEHVSTHDHWQGEIWDQRKNGSVYPAWFAITAIRDGKSEISNYMAILSDITDRKKNEEHTRHLAEHDFLTDLPNRVLLLDRLSLALAQARRRHSMLAILFLDLDHFKQVNDRYGHQVGDLVLKDVAQRLSKCVRGVDTVSRQGGDEFVIILSEIGGVDQAAHVANSVLQAIGQVNGVGGKEVHISASIGISVYPNDGDEIELLLKHADVAMYHAKEGGRNAFQFFNSAMNAHIVERVQLETALRQALARGEFVLDYQLEVDIAQGTPRAAEALIRWRHPERGLLMPEQFLAVAEECGLMLPIGQWVLREACSAAARWRAQNHALVVSVNLSTAQLLDPELLANVDAALADAGLAPELLDVELTEAVMMRGAPELHDTLAGLRARGIGLTIDDFGTGYSSLSYLGRFPLTKLKIDRSFVQAINGEPNDAAIVPAIIAMANSLHLTVVAEGVETAAQLAFLRRHACHAYQGNYAGPPVPGSAVAALAGAQAASTRTPDAPASTATGDAASRAGAPPPG